MNTNENEKKFNRVVCLLGSGCTHCLVTGSGTGMGTQAASGGTAKCIKKIRISVLVSYKSDQYKAGVAVLVSFLLNPQDGTFWIWIHSPVWASPPLVWSQLHHLPLSAPDRGSLWQKPAAGLGTGTGMGAGPT